MPLSRNTWSSLLLAVLILAGAAGVATLMPFHTKMVSDLGYHTLCPFAPYSTLALWFVAWLAWTIRKHLAAQSGA